MGTGGEAGAEVGSNVLQPDIAQRIPKKNAQKTRVLLNLIICFTQMELILTNKNCPKSKD
ncbi:hypothetical protein GCM10027164_25260 [Algoriphagus taiwanensis]